MKIKAIGAIVLAGLVYAVLSYFGLVPGMSRTASIVPQTVQLSEGDFSGSTQTVGNVAAVPLPGAQPAKINKPAIRYNLYPWTAHHGFLFAVGGATTTTGSLMEKRGVKISIERQDDVEKMKAAQALFANALAQGNSNPSDGVHFVAIMGDGAGTYLGSLNETLKPLGPEYQAEIIGAWGYSRGEDAFWGPHEWKDNCEAMKGGLVSAYLRDGDWNLAQYLLANCGVKNNPDETTWDPEALNWYSTSDFLKAVEAYVTGVCEERPVVRNGRVSQTEKKQVCVQGVATWTPGDVNMAERKGGLVKLISTKENPYQMPATIIGIKAWNARNAKLVEDMLASALEGSDQVRSHKEALSKAASIAANVWGEQNAAYWRRYYEGVRVKDKTGQLVELGGSEAANLADNLFLFGLAEGAGGLTSSAYAASYTGFADIVKQQYPRLLPWYPPITEAVNTTYLQSVAAKTTNIGEATLAKFEDTDEEIARESVVAKRNWTINFDTGKATFTPAAEKTLEDLYTQLTIGGGLSVQIDGHTDNVGNPASNSVLSGQRANAVKSYLEERAPALFPQGRVVTRGYGDTQPVADNSSASGRASNRRVTITLGTR